MFFVSLFTVEMFIKMYAVGFQGYFGSMFNRFDFFVIICSWAEAALTYYNLMNPLGVSVLRCARLLRVFKVTRCRFQCRFENPRRVDNPNVQNSSTFRQRLKHFCSRPRSLALLLTPL